MTRSSSRRHLMSNELLETAAELFAEHGYSATSLQDIAAAMGISRPALYHYVASKEDLLAQLVAGSTKDTARALARINADGSLSAQAKLEAAVRDMVRRIAESPARFKLLNRSEGYLPADVASEHHAAKRNVLDTLRNILEEGMAAGVFHARDAETVAFAVLGMCNWMAWWYQPGGRPGHRLDADAISDEFLSLLLGGVYRGAAVESPSAVIGDIREHLAVLERMMGGDGSGSRAGDGGKGSRTGRA